MINDPFDVNMIEIPLYLFLTQTVRAIQYATVDKPMPITLITPDPFDVVLLDQNIKSLDKPRYYIPHHYDENWDKDKEKQQYEIFICEYSETGFDIDEQIFIITDGDFNSDPCKYLKQLTGEKEAICFKVHGPIYHWLVRPGKDYNKFSWKGNVFKFNEWRKDLSI